MLRFTLAILATVLCAAGAIGAIELAGSPIHDAMRASLAGSVSVSPEVSLDREFDEFGGADERPRSGRKSTVRAALYSALIPGAGQYYLGSKRTARCFFVAEAATWVAYFSFRTYGGWLKNDYINYAAEHANARLDGKSEDFLTWVGFYANIREFNTLGRVSDTDRPYLEDVPSNHWEWQSASEQRMYRDLRNGSKEAYRRSDFVIGAAIINRMISVIDAIRSASRLGRRIDTDELTVKSERRFQFTLDPLARDQVSITVYPGF